MDNWPFLTTNLVKEVCLNVVCVLHVLVGILGFKRSPLPALTKEGVPMLHCMFSNYDQMGGGGCGQNELLRSNYTYSVVPKSRKGLVKRNALLKLSRWNEQLRCALDILQSLPG